MKLFLTKLLPAFLHDKLRGRSQLQKILANISWLFADKVIRLGVEVFLGAWLARYLGIEQFGIYSYAIAYVAIFRAFAGLGLDRIVVRNIVNSPESKDEIISNAFVLKLIGGIVSAIFAVVTIYGLRPDDQLLQSVVAILSLSMIVQAFDVVDLWFQSQVTSKNTVIAKNLVFLTISVSKFYLILIQAPLIYFVWLIFIEFCLLGIVLVLVFTRHQKQIKIGLFRFTKAKEILMDGLPLMFAVFAVIIYMKIDQVMLGEMTSSRDVGLYSAAVKISEAWYFFPAIIAKSVFPSVVKYREENKKKYYQKLQKLFVHLVGISYVVSIFFTVFSHQIITTLFGSEYYDSGLILSVHIWAGVFVSLGVIRGLWINAENINNFYFISTSIGALVNIGLNFILIPKMQGLGAAIATIIAQCLAALFLGFIFKKTRKISFNMLKSLALII